MRETKEKLTLGEEKRGGRIENNVIVKVETERQTRVNLSRNSNLFKSYKATIRAIFNQCTCEFNLLNP